MVENKYVRLEFNEALFSKKNLLSSEIDVLTTMKKIQEYKKRRKSEFILKNSLRNKMKELSEMLENLENILPRVTHLHLHPMHKLETPEEKAKKALIEAELREIREKLEKLNELSEIRK